MKKQLCFLPDDVGWLKSCEHDISSAVLRADQTIAAEIQGQAVELEGFPTGVHQIDLCKCGLWCLDQAGFVHRFNNRQDGQRWTRIRSLPNDSPIASICCFKDGSLCASTDDATLFVFQTNENKWIPQESRYKRSPFDSQDSEQPRVKPRAKKRFRFSVRMLILMMLALALLLAPVYYLRKCFEVRTAVDILLAQGHDIQFEHQFDANGNPIANATAPEPKWLDRIFGPRLLHRPIEFKQSGQLGSRTPSRLDLDSLSKMTTLQKARLLKPDEVVLNKLVNLRELEIEAQINDLSFIENMKELKDLNLRLHWEVDLTPIYSLPKLEVLWVVQRNYSKKEQHREIVKTNKSNLSPIAQCPNLRDLTFYGCEDTNELQRIIAPFTKLERLKSHTLVLDLDWVKQHPDLKSLKLNHFFVMPDGITDFSPLMELKQLEELELPISAKPELDFYGKLRPAGPTGLVPFDISVLKQIPNLTLGNVTLRPNCPRSDMSLRGFPILAPGELRLNLTNADSIPDSVSIATLRSVTLSEQFSDLTQFKGASLNKIRGIGSQVKDLEALRGIPLTYVNFNQTLVSDISPVANKRLRQLEIDDTAVSDLEPLRGLFLRTLTASNTPIKDISMLAGMKLSALDISGTQVDDMSLFTGKAFRSLDISGTRVRDLSAIKNVGYELNISNTPVSKLPSFRRLEILKLDHTPIKDIEIIRKMYRLKRLSLKGTPVSDLSPLIGLSDLDYIDVSDTKVDRIVDFYGRPRHVKLDRTNVTDLSLLAGCHELYLLSVSGTPVTDLSILNRMSGLKVLNISYTPITDLSPILKTGIKSLDLSGIKATDFSVLSKLPKLDHLRLGDLPLDRIPQLHPEMLLLELDLGGTQIKDLSPLFNQEYLYRLVLPESADFSPDMIDHWPQLEKLVIGEKVILDKKPDEYRPNPWTKILYFRVDYSR